MNCNAIESKLEKAKKESDAILIKYRSIDNLKKIHAR